MSPLGHPAEWAVRIDGDGRLSPVGGWEGFARRRQELPPAFSLNGGVYVARADHLRHGGCLVGPETVAVEMPPERSVDIDGAFDLALARFLVGETSS